MKSVVGIVVLCGLVAYVLPGFPVQAQSRPPKYDCVCVKPVPAAKDIRSFVLYGNGATQSLLALPTDKVFIITDVVVAMYYTHIGSVGFYENSTDGPIRGLIFVTGGEGANNRFPFNSGISFSPGSTVIASFHAEGGISDYPSVTISGYLADAD